MAPRVKPSGPCSFEGCNKPCRSLGYCKSHYDQQYKGRALKIPKQYRRSLERDEAGRKWCRTCDNWKQESDFASCSTKVDGLQSRCRSCNAAIYRSRADIVRDQMRQQRFGLTREAFDQLFAQQGKRCGICGTDEPGTNFWAVDHDHACCPGSEKTCGGCVRGILCARCNHGLGSFRDNTERLLAAIAYLEHPPVSASLLTNEAVA